MKKPKAKDFNLPYEQSEFNQAKDKYIDYLEKVINQINPDVYSQFTHKIILK